MEKTIYVTDSYIEIWSIYDNAIPVRIILKTTNAIFQVDLIVKKINGENDLFEGYTPYGYGGPILIEGNKNTKFPLDEFLNELRKRNIVNVFIRFSPFLENHKCFPSFLKELNRYTVSRTLKKTSHDETIKTFSKGTKWSIKKSIGSKVKISIVNGKAITENQINNFYDLYFLNMKNINAGNYYFLNRQCIKNHFAYLKNNIDLFEVELNNEVIATALFITDDKMCHYHLSACDKKYCKFYPMERILFEAIVFYGNQGKELLHLGGGTALEQSNPLFMFKKKFGDFVNEFYIGKLIANEYLYGKLRTEKNLNDSKYFLINDALNDCFENTERVNIK